MAGCDRTLGFEVVRVGQVSSASSPRARIPMSAVRSTTNRIERNNMFERYPVVRINTIRFAIEVQVGSPPQYSFFSPVT